MNILGHAYVATEAVKGNRKLLIIGSLLPESSPFIAQNPFTSEEIHESGEKFLKFLDQNYPKKRDLALGILAHSYKFGTDGWSRKIEELIRDDRGDFLRKITEASGWKNLRFAEFRLHNFLWWGMEVWILKNYRSFVRDLASVIETVDIEEISKLLTECFSKDFAEARKTVEFLFQNIYRPRDLKTVGGLARIWQRQAAGLPEKDRVDSKKTSILFEEIYLMFLNKWEEILEEITVKVSDNLNSFKS